MKRLGKILTITVTTVTAAISIELTSGIALASLPGNLTTDQAQDLRSLGIKIAVPGDIPAGFNVVKVTTVPCLPHAHRDKKGVCTDSSPEYTILYRNSQRTCFAIQEHGGGVGGADAEYIFPVKTKLFGEVSLEFGSIPGGGQRPTPEQLKMVQSDIGNFPADEPSSEPPYGPYYQVSTVENTSDCGKNESLTPLDIQAILQSLTWL